MIDIIAYVLAYLFYSFMGAFWVWNAITSFKNKRYFFFGFEIMAVCFNIGCMLELVFKT